MSFFSWLFGSRANAPRPSATPLPEVTQDMEEGFVDLAFALTSLERSANGSSEGVAMAVHQGKTVGFRFGLPAAWKQGTLGDTGVVTYQGTVEIGRSGPESDLLVMTLAELYQCAEQPTQMAPSVTFLALSLQGNPSQLESGPIKLKLFVEPQEEGEEAYEQFYAEHYLNINLAAHRVELREKDSSYREAMLRALSGMK